MRLTARYCIVEYGIRLVTSQQRIAILDITKLLSESTMLGYAPFWIYQDSALQPILHSPSTENNLGTTNGNMCLAESYRSISTL